MWLCAIEYCLSAPPAETKRFYQSHVGKIVIATEIEGKKTLRALFS